MSPSATQEQALRIALACGEVRRRDLVTRLGISRTIAQRALAGLERAGVIRRERRGRGVRYVLASPVGGGGPVAEPAPARQ